MDVPTAYWTPSSGRDGGSRGEVSASKVRQSAEISPLDAGMGRGGRSASVRGAWLAGGYPFAAIRACPPRALSTGST